MNNQTLWHSKIGWGMLAVVLWLPADRGITQPFVIDASRSTIKLSGNVAGEDFLPQSADDSSLETTYSGTINATADGNTIRFTGGSQVIAANSGSWEPLANGEPGKAPANYGAMAANFLATAKAAARNLQFDVTSQPLTLTADSFSAADILFSVVTGSGATVDYNVTGFVNEMGTLALEEAATNKVATQGTLVTAGNVQTLTIPVQAEYTFDLLFENDTVLKLEGQLVATRPVDGGGGETEFDGWLAANFPGVTDPAVIGPAADPDGDDIPNFAEFAFGRNPKIKDTSFSPLVARIDPQVPDVLTLEFVRPKGLVGVSYTLQAADALGNWVPLGGSPVITDLGGGFERVSYRDTEPVGLANQRFIWLTVTKL